MMFNLRHCRPCMCVQRLLRVLALKRHYAISNENRGMPEYCDSPFGVEASEIIDVRTPTEFAVDHIPRAVNLPVLGQNEHHEVGCLYKSNQFDARKLGAGIVSRNISRLLSSHFKDKESDYHPLIYCFRGGQRSLSLAIVLSQIGFKVSVLKGGYKNYRRLVQEQLTELPKEFNFNVISGLTGSGKTLLLHALHSFGEQVLDLEALANHRGSVLGLEPGVCQPSQKYWESLLRDKLSSFDPSRPVWVESESRGIGRCFIPEEMFKAMCCNSKKYVISLPLDERIQHIISEYRFWTVQKEDTIACITNLEKFHDRKKIEHWCELVRKEQWEDFVKDLLTEHYDKAYSHSQKKMFSMSGDNSVEKLMIPDLTRDTLSDLVKRIV